MRKTSFLAALFFASLLSQAQQPVIEILTSGTKTSLRGLSVVNDNVLWVSGSGGMVGRSTNGGKNFKWVTVKGFEKTEFRDIHAFDANTAIIMGVAEPAYILKTIDGGDTWKIVYENKTKGMFLDAMDFSDNQQGIVIGDPIEGRIFLAKTRDSGNSWQEIGDDPAMARPDSGEAFFASSGSNVRLFENGEFLLVSGGRRSRLFTGNSVQDLPILQGRESTGANSLDIFDNGVADKPGQRMVVVGGDFTADSSIEKNCFYTLNGGKTWLSPVTAPHGYRSCVEFLSKKVVLACGLNGVDYSDDAGKNWKWISKEGFHVCRIARIGTTVYLAGGKGRVAKLTWK